MKPLLVVIDTLSEYSGRIFAYLSIPVILIILAEVIGRYFFNRPLIWSHESMTFVSAFLYLMGGAYVLKQRAHTSVDVLQRLLPVRGRAILEMVVFIFFLIYIITLLRTSTHFALKSISILEKSGTPWNPIVYPIKSGILLATILLFLAGIGNFLKDLKVVITGKEEDITGVEIAGKEEVS